MKQRLTAHALTRGLFVLAFLGGAPFAAGTRAPRGHAAAARPQGGGMAVREPLTRDWLLRALRERPLDEDGLVWRIEANGSNYLPDAEGERELRAAGATDRILAALRKCHRVEAPGGGGQGPPAAPVDYTRPFEYCQLTTPAVITHRPYPEVKEDPFKNEGPLKNGDRPGVRLSVVLNPDGTVTDIRVITDLPDKLTKKFVAAAGRIKFRPAEKDGRKVAMRATFVYFFGY